VRNIVSVNLNFVFISYEDKSGLLLATAIRAALTSERVAGWVWQIDHPSGYVHSEIANRISEADYLCCVCTEGTITSEGQEWEFNNAFGQGKLKRAWVVAPNRKFVPPMLAGYFQYEATPDTAQDVVKDWCERCRGNFPGWPTIRQDAAESQADDAKQLVATRLVDDQQ
jgi:hypothetical protein